MKRSDPRPSRSSCLALGGVRRRAALGPEAVRQGFGQPAARAHSAAARGASRTSRSPTTPTTSPIRSSRARSSRRRPPRSPAASSRPIPTGARSRSRPIRWRTSRWSARCSRRRRSTRWSGRRTTACSASGRAISRAELRAHHRDFGIRDQAEGTGPGQRRRLEGRRPLAAAAGRITGGSAHEAPNQAHYVARSTRGSRSSCPRRASPPTRRRTRSRRSTCPRRAGGKVVVRVTLKEAPANPPAGFTINNPPRIAFDFPNTGSSAGPQHPGRRRGRSAQHQRRAGGRPHAPRAESRARALRYDTQIDGKTLLITLQGAAAAAGPSGVTTHFAEPRAGDPRHARARRRLPPRRHRRRPHRRRSVRQRGRHRSQAAGPADRDRLHQHRAAQEPGAPARRDRFRHRRCRRSTPSPRAATRAW